MGETGRNHTLTSIAMVHFSINKLLIIQILCLQIFVIRAMEDVAQTDVEGDYDVQLDDIPMDPFKRSLSVSSGSRRSRGDPFAFGLGKRADPFAFGLGRRKRFYWKYNPFNFLKEEGIKRDPYAFGLGK